MDITDEELIATTDSLFDEIQNLTKQLEAKKKLHLRLVAITKRTRKVLSDPEDETSVVVEDVPLIDDATGAEMTDRRRQEVLDEIRKSNPKIFA